MVKHQLNMQETWVQSLDGEDALEKEMAPTPALLPGKSHGWRSPVSYSPWGCKESDTTERLHSLSLSLGDQSFGASTSVSVLPKNI